VRPRGTRGCTPAKAQLRKSKKSKRSYRAKLALDGGPSADNQVVEIARLTGELNEALERQRATADILAAISRSSFELQPILQSVVDTASQLCRADASVIFRLEGGVYRFAAGYSLVPEYVEHERRNPISPGPGTLIGRAAMSRQVVQIEDAWTDPLYEQKAVVGGRSMMGVPLMRRGEPIGVIGLSRSRVAPFTQREIELVTTFADQAVIAIENARLLNELRQSLDQQIATSEVLGVISRSKFDLQPVLQSVVDTAARLCRAEQAGIYRLEGGNYRGVAASGHGIVPAYYEIEQRELISPGPGTVVGRAAMNHDVVQITDAWTDPLYDKKKDAELGGVRSMIGVPLMHDGRPIGVIALARTRVEPFVEREIELVKNFADQAVIAIENARLLAELRQRTADLTESLEQQTATSSVFEVISRSAFDLQAVFETVAESSVRLCGADRAFILRFDGEMLRVVATHNAAPEFKNWVSQHPIRPGRHSAAARAGLERRTIHIPDALADPEYSYGMGAPGVEAFRTILAVPIIKGSALLGTMVIYHLEVRPFTDKQIALVETFADQAAIAIDNVRLLDELRQRTDELGRSVGELRALGEVSQAVNSTLDLQAVLSTIVAKAVQLSGTEAGAIYVFDNLQREFHLRATYGMDQELITALTEQHIRLDEPIVAQVLAQPEPIQVADLRDGEPSAVNEVILRAGFRALLVAPLRGGEDLVGMLVVRRRTPGAFEPNTIDLMKTFAAQSALAIQNARLFHEIEEKSRQLAEASQHKSQFLANMSHELRTPLNAILGYTELMADGAYGEPSERMMGVLKRLESNGKHLLGLINDVLDLSKIEAGQLALDLAEYSLKDVAQTVYSAVEPLAADKKLKFITEITPDLPRGRGDERRLTQVLLNLVGNAIKFTDDGEVAIKVSMANGVFNVAVHDTGPGISAADQDKLFQEFQQADNSMTKRKGGTGLGLAISKRIIEMHGGRIWVDSTVGQGSTFAFTLPVHVAQQIEPT
jgi:GAF domain-containing protein